MRTKNATIQGKAGPGDGLDEGQFTAYASVFGNVDSYGDVVVKGAFENDLTRWAESANSLPVLYGHDVHDPFSNIGHVVEAAEDERGLRITGQLDLDNPKAAQVYRLLKGRRIGDMSFAFDVLDSAAIDIDGKHATELRELKLYEVSVVPIGANPETEILSVKAAGELAADGTCGGRAILTTGESNLRTAHELIGTVLEAFENADQDKAVGHIEAKPLAPSEEPSPAKSGAGVEELRVRPSAQHLIAEVKLLGLVEARKGFL